MSVCVYDNPNTMRREAWQDGTCIAHITMEQMYVKGFDGSPTMFFGLNVGRNFVGDKIYGDKAALYDNVSTVQ